MNNTGEQVVPHLSKERLWREHLARYEFTKNLIGNGKTILDIACGTGYGTNLLASKAKSAVGVDLSQDSIKYAQEHYSFPNLKFIKGRAEDNLFSSSTFDVICSFETIEHLDSKARKNFLANLRNWTKSNGIIIISTPNKVITSPFSSEPSNKFHVLEFSLKQLLSEIDSFIAVDHIYGQRLIPEILTNFFVRKFINFIQKIIRHNFRFYTSFFGDTQVRNYRLSYEPRILVVVGHPKK